MKNNAINLFLLIACKFEVSSLVEFIGLDTTAFIKLTCSTHVVSWEPEGHYHYSTMFRREPEGCHLSTKSMVIAPFWFSQGCECSDFNLISDLFCSSQNPIFRLLMHWKAYLFKHFRLFQTFSDFFRLFQTFSHRRSHTRSQRNIVDKCHSGSEPMTYSIWLIHIFRQALQKVAFIVCDWITVFPRFTRDISRSLAFYRK